MTFARRSRGALPAAATALALAAPVWGEDAGARQPNLLIVTVDTLRADRLGREPSVMPHLDRLAERGVVFEVAVTPIGTTLPAHTSLFTGLYPREHGVRWNGDTVPDDLTTMAEHFRAAGFDTAAFVSCRDMVTKAGLGQGFETIIEPSPTGRPELPCSEVNDQAIPWILEKRSRPFFVWVHYYVEVHCPYDLTEYASRRLEGYEGPYREGASMERFLEYNKRPELRTEQNRRALEALYDGQVLEADAALGALVDAAVKSEHPTVLVVTADHGQLLGEHDRVGHGALVWEDILRIPLVIVHPAGKPRSVPTRVGLIDLFPTLLETFDIEVPKGQRGRSLLPAIRGEDLEPRPYFAEVRVPALRKSEPRRLVAVMSEERKVVLEDGRPWVTDLSDDPEETERAGPASSDEALVGQLRAFESLEPRISGEAPIDPSRLERLRALGYLD